jgi:glycosyltransferase involved in cell wall biosynthesis
MSAEVRPDEGAAKAASAGHQDGPRPRLCFVGWADHVHLERWAGYFAAQGYPVDVISYSGRGRYPPGVRQHVLGLKGRGARWIRLRLRYLLWRIRPELVHVHWAHFAVDVRPVWRGPLVVTAWGSDIYRRDQFDDAQWGRLGDALRHSQLVTCDSEDLAHSMRESFALTVGQVRVVQWGVDTRMFQPNGHNLRETLGLIGRRIIFSARNFTPLYNQESIVRAFAQVRQRHGDAFLIMKSYGGDPAYLDRMRAEIAALNLVDHVRILEAMPYEEMPALYRTADVTVSVPLSDAAPMSLLEAMASGSPCVVCDLPSLREWVVEGQTGHLVPAEDVDAIANAMTSALEDDAARTRITRNAREMVVARASQDVHMATAGKCYAVLAGRGYPGGALAHS